MKQLTMSEHVLRLFTDIKAGEGTTALLMFVNVFLILCAYYFIKPLREGWIAVSAIEGLSKMEVKAYSSFAQSVVLIFIVGWYGKLAEQFDKVKLIARATYFCIANMLVFWFLQPGFFFAHLPLSGIIFYLWVGMFGVFVVAQFWAFCADIYSEESGKRLMPLIAIGATSGAASGSWLVDQLINLQIIETESLLLAATLPLFVSIVLTRIVAARQNTLQINSSIRTNHTSNSLKCKDKGSIIDSSKLIFTSRFLLAAALVTLLNNWVNTNGENLLFQVVQDTLTEAALANGITEASAIQVYTLEGTTGFYGNFYFWVNSIALILQAFFASRLLKYGGFGVTLLMLPVVALISYTCMALVPVLLIVKIMKIAENASDYSINNTARHVLWLPVDSTTKFQAKPAIDTLYVRIGDGLAALTVLLGVQALGLSLTGFFAVNVFLVLMWIGGCVILAREYHYALNDETKIIK